VTSSTFAQRRRFIIKLGRSLHKAGTPAYRLEAHLINVAAILGMQGSLLISPTSMTFVMWEKGQATDDDMFGERQEFHHVVRVSPGEIDLGSLARTDELVDELATGQRSLVQASERLDEIEAKPNPYSQLSTLAAFAISGGAFAMLMGTSWSDVFWSFWLSLLVYGFVYWSTLSKRVTNTLEPLVALVSAFVVTGVMHFDPGINASLVVLSSIIVFIPGLALTLGLRELAARDLLSGTARIMDAIMLLFKLYFGAVLGLELGYACWGRVEFVQPDVIPQWTAWFAVLALSASLVVMFKTRLKDGFWGIMSGFIAYSTSILAASYFDIALGTFFGAFCVGIYANVYARVLKAPAIIVSLQGLVILVPGSKVYIGLNTIVSGENMLGPEPMGTQALMIFMSLIAGLIFSNLVVQPRRTL